MPMDNYRQVFKSAIARVYHKNGAVVGAGFLVSSRYILTCAHLVTTALGVITIENLPSDLVELDFPLISPGHKIKAKVVFCNSPESNEDIAALELETKPPDGCYPVKLLNTEDFGNHAFQIFGFPKQRDFGVWASGVLRDRISNGWVQIEDIKAQGYQIEQGFSGAPIWDEDLKAVVGMAVAVDKNQEAKVSFMIPNSMLVSAWSELEQSVQIIQRQSKSASDSLPSFRQIQLKAKGGNLKVLLAKYEAAYNQLNYTLSQPDIISIKEQIKFLESEIVQLETEINNLVG
jgi:S1-C subfamily serine protease